jgi:hypothetical protein
MTQDQFTRALNWVRYSGVSVIITLNPLHWRWIPAAKHEQNIEWPNPNEHTYMAAWLFLTVRIWIDNGDW